MGRGWSGGVVEWGRWELAVKWRHRIARGLSPGNRCITDSNHSGLKHTAEPQPMQIRTPLQGDFIAGPDPGLKPWAILFRHFMATYASPHRAHHSNTPQFSRSDRVLGDAVTERPILFFDFNQINEDVFTPKPNRGVQAVGDRLVERLFLFRVPSFTPGDLDDHEVVGAIDIDVIGVKKKAIGIVLTNDLETVIFGDADPHQRLIHDLAYFLPVGGILTFA